MTLIQHLDGIEAREKRVLEIQAEQERIGGRIQYHHDSLKAENARLISLRTELVNLMSESRAAHEQLEQLQKESA